MGQTRSERFSADQNQLARLAKALGHPARIAILEYLLQADRCICGDIVEALPLSQATISQHLRELKTVGLIKGTIEGVSVCYCIDHEVWQQHASLLQSFFEKKGPKENCCP
jgi:ArsR family transcriptional regulator